MTSRGPSPWLVTGALFIAACGDDCDRHERHYEPTSCLNAQDEPSTPVGDCEDEFEPNGDLPRAAVSPTEHECYDTVKTATIADNDDVDVYRTGKCDLSNGFLRTQDVLVTSADIETDANLRMCIFPTCHGGDSNVYACYETTKGGVETEIAPTRTHSGFIGCCRGGAGSVTALSDCSLKSPEVDTYLWVEAANTDVEGTCHPYTLHWNLL